MSSRGKMTLLLLLLLCSHSPNDVPPTEPQRNVSIAAVRGAVRPSKNDSVVVNPPFILPQERILSFKSRPHFRSALVSRIASRLLFFVKNEKE